MKLICLQILIAKRGYIKMKKPKPVNYVNNQQLLSNLAIYKKLCIEARELNQPDPPMPRNVGNAIGLAILQISERLVTRHNFNGYTFREEMVGDGILAALKSIKNFDVEKSQNPFAYFTQIIFNAFVKRINVEKQERNTRNQLMFFGNEDQFLEDKNNIQSNMNNNNLFMLMNQ